MLHLLLLFRCTTLEYAQKFIDTGNIRFGTPDEWIKAAQNTNFGRGDFLEGSCCAISKCGIKEVNPSPEFVVKEDKGFIFYQKKDVLNLRTFCLFGLSEFNFTKQARATDKKMVPSAEIDNSYFHSFFPNIEIKEYEQLEPQKKPAVIIINKPDVFIKRLRDKLISIGFNPEEIIIRLVQYINKYIPHNIKAPHPYELFFKDLSYKDQSEFRIVINCKKSEAVDNLIKQNGIINIGNLSDIAQVYDYYFDDLKMIFHDNILEFSLPKGHSYTLTNPFEMMCLIRQALSDEMPCEDSWENNKRFIDDRLKELQEKHSIYFDWATLKFHKKGGEIIFDASDSIDNICRHVDTFIAQGEFQKAVNSCKLAIHLMPSSNKGHKKLEELYSYCKTHNIKIKLLNNE